MKRLLRIDNLSKVGILNFGSIDLCIRITRKIRPMFFVFDEHSLE